MKIAKRLCRRCEKRPVKWPRYCPAYCTMRCAASAAPVRSDEVLDGAGDPEVAGWCEGCGIYSHHNAQESPLLCDECLEA